MYIYYYYSSICTTSRIPCSKRVVVAAETTFSVHAPVWSCHQPFVYKLSSFKRIIHLKFNKRIYIWFHICHYSFFKMCFGSAQLENNMVHIRIFLLNMVLTYENLSLFHYENPRTDCTVQMSPQNVKSVQYFSHRPKLRFQTLFYIYTYMEITAPHWSLSSFLYHLPFKGFKNSTFCFESKLLFKALQLHLI